MLPPVRGSNIAAVAFLVGTATPFVNGATTDQSAYNQAQPAAVAARNAFVAIPVVPIAEGGEVLRRLRSPNISNNNHNRNIHGDTINITPRAAGDDSTRVHIGINDPPTNSNSKEGDAVGEKEQAAVDGALVTIMETLPTSTAATVPSPTGTILSSASSTAAAAGSIMETDNPTECRLLGSFAILVQLALGGLALLSLVFKRWRERPQRPVKIWWFDVSKQVFGSVLVHAANVFMSLLTSGKFSIRAATESAVIHQERSLGLGIVLVRRGLEVAGILGRRATEPYVPNPCSFYLLNLGIDVSSPYFTYSFVYYAGYYTTKEVLRRHH